MTTTKQVEVYAYREKIQEFLRTRLIQTIGYCEEVDEWL